MISDLLLYRRLREIAGATHYLAHGQLNSPRQSKSFQHAAVQVRVRPREVIAAGESHPLGENRPQNLRPVTEVAGAQDLGAVKQTNPIKDPQITIPVVRDHPSATRAESTSIADGDATTTGRQDNG